MTLLGGPALDPSLLFASVPGRRRDSSVDLSIGVMFNDTGDDLGTSYTLQPGEMVLVASSEVLKLPPNMTGLVACKTELTHAGVWAITVGIVDPCWLGPVSTTLVNFGAHAKVLERGDTFLRVAFFKHDSQSHAQNPTTVDADQVRKEYISKVRQNSVRFKKTFMDIKKITKDAGDAAFEIVRNSVVIWIAILGLIFTIVQVIGVPSAGHDQASLTQLNERIAQLERRLDTERLEESK